MPANTMAQDAAQAQTQWNTFLANWNRASALTNATTLGQRIAPSVADYRRNAQRGMGYVATGIGKSGNFQFNQAVALGDTSSLTPISPDAQELAIDAQGLGLAALDNMEGLVEQEIADIETILGLNRSNPNIDPSSDIVDLQTQIAAIDDDIRSTYQWESGWRDNPDANMYETLQMWRGVYEKQLTDAQNMWDPSNWADRAIEGIVEGFGGDHTNAEESARSAIAFIDEQLARYETVMGTRQSLTEKLSGEDGTGGLVGIRDSMRQWRRDVDGLLDSALTSAATDPIAANQSLSLTSGSTALNASAMLTQLEKGRVRLVNESVAEISNLVGQAAMADDAAAFEADMGQIQLMSLDLERQMTELNNIFTVARFGIQLFGG